MTKEVLRFEGATPCKSSACQILTVDVNQLCVQRLSCLILEMSLSSWLILIAVPYPSLMNTKKTKSKVVSQGQICPPCLLTWVRYTYSVSLNGSDMRTLPVYMGQICPLCQLKWVRKAQPSPYMAYKFTACILQKRIDV